MSMKFAKLLHNPGAGDAAHSAELLLKTIEEAGYQCEYDPDKKVKDQKIKPHKLDLVILAGGDGTVRKVANQLMHEDLPIGLIPMGTANNIARALSISGEPREIIEGWSEDNITGFDVGHLSGLEDVTIFLEGFGFGVFPMLMDTIKKQKIELGEEPGEKIKSALELLYEIVESFEPFECSIKIEGVEYKGRFLLVEVMNIQSIGPTLELAPVADPGDGEMEVVMIPESQRKELLDYLSEKLKGSDASRFFNIVRAKSLKMVCACEQAHVDDQRIKWADNKREIYINLQSHGLKFLSSKKKKD